MIKDCDKFMAMAEQEAEESTCLRRKVGAVIVKDGEEIAKGYNATPNGVDSCIDEGVCFRKLVGIPSGTRHELCKGIHAEQSAIAYCAKNGISCEGATLYVTVQPCSICSRMLINAGIEKVVYKGDYPDTLSQDLLNKAGIEVIIYKEGE